jgi:BMFP domain-containing protein YqiC
MRLAFSDGLRYQSHMGNDSIENLARKLAESVPEGLRSMRDDLETNFRGVLRAGISKLDLVTRDEFEVQEAVLARTREKLEGLEAKLEEMEKDYVRTARAKGLDDVAVMFRHVLKNALVPILTGVVAILPLLFMGSLLVESFFGIPGLGSYTIDGIQRQDFAIVRSMVFLGSVLYVLGLLLTDISYTFVDPRVRLSG